MTRKEITIAAYNNGTIKLDTFGQLDCNNYTDEIVERAIERKWITEKFGVELLNAENPRRW